MMDNLLEMNDLALCESMERVAQEMSRGDYYVSFVVRLLGLIDSERTAFGEERSEAMVARVCKAIKKKGLLSVAINRMTAKAKEDSNRVCLRKAATWCCGEFYTFANGDVKKEIANFFRGIKDKSDPYLLIALTKLPKEDELLSKDLLSSMGNIGCKQTRTLKNVITAAMKADPALILFDVTPQEDATVPIADTLAAFDKPALESVDPFSANFNGNGLLRNEGSESLSMHKSPEGEKDPFDFW